MSDSPEDIKDKERSRVFTAATSLDTAGSTERGLCASCTHSTVYRRHGDAGVQGRDSKIWCSMIGREMPPDISECSKYWSVKRMTIFDMHNIAILIDPRVAVNDGSYR